MSELIINKNIASEIFNWDTNPPCIKTKKDVKGTDIKSYSTVLAGLIKDKYDTKVYVKAGCNVGKKFTSIYLECCHRVSFTCQILTKKLKHETDLEFSITRSTDISCACGKIS